MVVLSPVFCSKFSLRVIHFCRKQSQSQIIPEKEKTKSTEAINEMPLPDNWEKAYTREGEPYFVEYVLTYFVFMFSVCFPLMSD